MRGENDVGALRIAQHEIAAEGPSPLLDPQAGQPALQEFDEAQLLRLRLAHLPVAQDLAGKLGHKWNLLKKGPEKLSGPRCFTVASR